MTSNADSGTGTLRAAANKASGNGVADTITFKLPSNKRTIRLEGQIIFTDEGRITTIDGGNAGVTVSGNNQTRVFYVNGGAKLDVNDLTVSGANAAAGSGIYNRRGEVNITDSTIRGNKATYGGGGIWTFGLMRITRSTVSGNSASYGGGIITKTNEYMPETTTISGNSAQGYGGGVYNDSDGPTTIRSSTITNNSAPSGKGAGVASRGYAHPPTEVSSSIIAANSTTDVDYVDGTTNSFASEGYNLIGDGNATGAFNKAGDQTIGNGSPGLGPLANNGGPTQTHALRASSPALNTIPSGTNGCGITLTTDQRGVSRPQGSACDTGSFERQDLAPAISVVAGSVSQSACLATNKGRVTFKLSDPDGDPLTLSATSSNTTLGPTNNIAFGGTGATRTATITTGSGQTGTSNLEITVSDGAKSTTVPVTVKAKGSTNNSLIGTTGADLLLGQGGADTLYGLGSNDVLCGAAGSDSLTGGSRADTFGGGTGTDTALDYSAAQGDSTVNLP